MQSSDPNDAAGTRSAVLDVVNGHDFGSVPAGGRTAERWLGLFDLAADADVSVARLCEAHLDAVAILAEADRRPRPGCLYGVWASSRPDGRDVELSGDELSGMKSFGSGIGIVDRALIDIVDRGRRQLVDARVDVASRSDGAWESADGRRTAVVEWANAGLAATNTGSMNFDRSDDVDAVGPPGWYLDRPGFWHGAIGPAACWAGSAAGLHRVDRSAARDDHRLATVGAMAADVWTMRAVLREAGDLADLRPLDGDHARRTARQARRAIHELATSVVDAFLREFGPRPLVDGSGDGQRVADVVVYLRQHHDRRDLAALGADLVAQRAVVPDEARADRP